MVVWKPHVLPSLTMIMSRRIKKLYLLRNLECLKKNHIYRIHLVIMYPLIHMPWTHMFSAYVSFKCVLSSCMFLCGCLSHWCVGYTCGRVYLMYIGDTKIFFLITLYSILFGLMDNFKLILTTLLTSC